MSSLASEPSLHPLKYLDAIPSPAMPGTGKAAWRISLAHSNQFMGGETEREYLRLDGETTLLGFEYQRRLSADGCWRGAVLLPFVHHGGGQFDDAISEWHQFFGFPDANRADSAARQISYYYRNEEGEVLELQQSVTAVADISLQLLKPLACRPSPSSVRGLGGVDVRQRSEDSNRPAGEPVGRQPASLEGAPAVGRAGLLRWSLVLPTGSVRDFSGSGRARVGVDWQSGEWRVGPRATLAGLLGMAWLGERSAITTRRDFIAYGSVGIRYAIGSRLGLRLQVDAHSPWYRSELRELGDPGVTLATGFDWHLPGPRARRLELSVVEDLAIDTAADIAIRISLLSR